MYFCIRKNSNLKINLTLFMKKLVLILLLTVQTLFVYSQASGGLSGKIVDSKSQKPLSNVVVSVQNLNLTEVTDKEGKFAFIRIPVGNQLIQIRNSGQYLNGANRNSPGLGLENTKQRLKLIYGDKASFRILTENDTFVLTEIEIPHLR